MMRRDSIEDFITELVVRNCYTCADYSRSMCECCRTGSRKKHNGYCPEWKIKSEILDLFLPNADDYQN